MATTNPQKKGASDSNHTQAPLWSYGRAAAKRAEEEATAACGHETAIEKDGETHCWDCFKADLEHFSIDEDSEDE